MRLIAGGLQKPLPCGVGIGHRFLGGKGFGRDDEQRAFGPHPAQRFRNVRTVHVRHKMRPNALRPIRPQRFGDHHRAEVGAAYAYVYIIGDALAGVASPIAAVYLGAKLLHARQHSMDGRHHIGAVDQHRPAGTIAQSGVQHSAVFCFVDGFAGKHLRNGLGELRFAGQLQQQVQRFGGEDVFGIIGQQVFKPERKCIKPLCVGGEQITHLHQLDGFVMGEQFLPGCGFNRVDPRKYHGVFGF